MRNYTYMTDQMGNVTGLVDSATGEARRQVFDAFGVNIGGYITFRCAADHDWADEPWHAYTQCWHWDPPPPPPISNGPEQPCPVPELSPPVVHQPGPVERMQTGSFNWRGGEGSITDRATHDMEDTETWETRWSAYTRPSTGLIYMGARYYEPETGRFTQADPVAYGPEMMWGQNDRWTYCGNDPVNLTDPTGLWIIALVLALAFAIGFGIGLWVAVNRPGANPWSLADEIISQVIGVLVGTTVTAGGVCVAGAGAGVGAGILGVVMAMQAAIIAVFMAGLLTGLLVGSVLTMAEPRATRDDELDLRHKDYLSPTWAAVYARSTASAILDAG